MPRGKPDYSNPEFAQAVPQIDQSSLIAGLRGIQSFDGRGRPLFADDFSNGLNGWVASISGTGATLRLTHPGELTLIPPHSLNIYTPNHSANGHIYKYWGGVPSSNIGVEMMFWYTPFSTPLRLQIIHTNENMIGKYGQLDFDLTNQEVTIYNGSGNVSVADVSGWSAVDYGFINLKLVCDFKNNTYKRVIIGTVIYDVDTIPLVSTNGASPGFTKIDIKFTTTATAHGNQTIGQVIFTTDEP